MVPKETALETAALKMVALEAMRHRLHHHLTPPENLKEMVREVMATLVQAIWSRPTQEQTLVLRNPMVHHHPEVMVRE